MNTSKKKTPKKATSKRKASREPLTSASIAAEEIEEEAGDVGRVAHICFFSTWEFPPFLRDGIKDLIARAAAQLNMPDPEQTKDDRTAYRQLCELFRATGDAFKLPTPTVADHVAAILNAPGRTVPLSLYNALADYIQQKIEATGLDAPIPAANRLPVVKMVLAAELADELERGKG
jgi:hypothetical protein